MRQFVFWVPTIFVTQRKQLRRILARKQSAGELGWSRDGVFVPLLSLFWGVRPKRPEDGAPLPNIYISLYATGAAEVKQKRPGVHRHFDLLE